MRKLLVAILILLAVMAAVLHGDSLREFIEAVRFANIIPLMIAIAFQLMKYVFQGFGLQRAFSATSQRISAKTTCKWIFAMFFINTAVPSVGVSGIAIVSDDATKQGLSAGKSASATLLFQIAIDSGFFLILLVAFAILIAKGMLHPLWIILAICAFGLIALMFSLLVIGNRSPELLQRFAKFIERISQKIASRFKRDVQLDFADRISGSFSEASIEISSHPLRALSIFAFTLAASACEMVCFYCCSVAFGVDYIPAIVCGYAISTLLAMVSITPQGIGFVEAGAVFAFVGMGFSQAIAAAIIAVYRGLVFWMPFAIGAIVANKTGIFAGKDAKMPES